MLLLMISKIILRFFIKKKKVKRYQYSLDFGHSFLLDLFLILAKMCMIISEKYGILYARVFRNIILDIKCRHRKNPNHKHKRHHFSANSIVTNL